MASRLSMPKVCVLIFKIKIEFYYFTIRISQAMDTISGASSGSYFVGWGTLALINAGLAQGKGRTGLNWFLISLLLGPIATLFLVLMEDLRTH